jgi:hypothetical protein
MLGGIMFKSASTPVNLLWLVFFIIYAIYKYVGSLQVWDPEFFVQVAILVVLTALIPYYVSRALAHKLTDPAKLITTIILPLALCALGYTIFYYTRVKPNFPNVSLTGDVLPRSFLPGFVMTALFLLERYLGGKKQG